MEGRLVETDRCWGLSNGFDRMELILDDPVAHAGRARDANAGETYRGRLRVCVCACACGLELGRREWPDQAQAQAQGQGRAKGVKRGDE